MAGVKAIKTKADVIAFAQENYDNGGAEIIESWDQQMINNVFRQAELAGVSARTILSRIFKANVEAKASAERTATVETPAPVEPAKVEEAKSDEPAKPKAKRTRKPAATDLTLVIASGESVKLTQKQVEFMERLSSDNFWENGLESTLWVDIYCDTLSDTMPPMTVGAMITTLNEKGIIGVGQDRVNGRKARFFSLTEKGKMVYTALVNQFNKGGH